MKNSPSSTLKLEDFTRGEVAEVLAQAPDHDLGHRLLREMADARNINGDRPAAPGTTRCRPTWKKGCISMTTPSPIQDRGRQSPTGRERRCPSPPPDGSGFLVDLFRPHPSGEPQSGRRAALLLSAARSLPSVRLLSGSEGRMGAFGSSLASPVDRAVCAGGSRAILRTAAEGDARAEGACAAGW